jgi:hypothetical protein
MREACSVSAFTIQSRKSFAQAWPALLGATLGCASDCITLFLTFSKKISFTFVYRYQAGYLFIPFGVYGEQGVLKPKKEFIPQGVEFVVDETTKIDAEQRTVETRKSSYDCDWLIISTGCDITPSEVEGMTDGWRENIFDFYTLEGANALKRELMRHTRNLSFSLDQLKTLIDFVLTAEPLMKTTVPQVIFYLDALEQRGLFRFLNMGLDAFSRIRSQYTEEKCRNWETVLSDWRIS